MMAPRRTHADWCWRIRGAERGSLAGRLDAIGWGAFFIWIGIALLADFGWGLALLGIGLITLAGQVTRWFYRLELEGFWLLVGAGFLLGGIWQLVDATLPLAPVLLVLAGLALVVAALRPRHRRDES
jgi:hypothetical protein